MNRKAWQATAHRVTQESDMTEAAYYTHTNTLYILEKFFMILFRIKKI